jgi:murein DD-endopeptidase MepM/ murein hydrolase activator NlpD
VLSATRPFNPLPLKLLPTSDMAAPLAPSLTTTILPLSPHPCGFGVVRGQQAHEGVDLFCHEASEVFAIEDGIVVAVPPFRGTHAGTPWWLNTWAVMVEGRSGVLVYGHLQPAVLVGEVVNSGQYLGQVLPVLRESKGKPRSMLHIELYETGTRLCSLWIPQEQRPPNLLDPTPLLMRIANGG